MFRKMRLNRLKILMISSYSLLLICSCLWLSVQFRSEQLQLGRDLAKLFNNVQEQISDSLMMVHVVTPAIQVQDKAGSPQSLAVSQSSQRVVAREIKLLVQQVAGLSAVRQEELIRMDTVAFNKLFVSRMQENGWNFKARWITSKDSNEQEHGNHVFLNSRFFNNKSGVVVAHINGFLVKRTVPQLCFIIVMLTVTGAAFLALYRSLKDQIQLSKLKDDFVSNMSHELKTPVTTVKLALEAMMDEEVMQDKALYSRYIHMAVKETERLEQLMTSTLNTSLMESGKLFLQPEQYDLEQLVTEVVAAYRLKVGQHHGHISLDVKGNHFTAYIDRLHTQGVLLNILDNSCKYAGNGVSIKVLLEECDQTISLSVTDNGPGIPEEYCHKVFEKFFRVPAENGHHEVKGYGLGLSYAAQVMAQQYGRIRVANIPGGGCAFTLTF